MSYVGKGATSAILEDIKKKKKTPETALEEWVDENLNYSFSQAMQRFDESLGTGHFTSIVANVANNKLMEGYAIGDEWRRLCEVRILTDMKETQTTSFGGFNRISAKAEHEAFEQVNPSDGKEVYTPKDYGRIFSITVNAKASDQINAFSRWTKEEGVAFNRTLNYEMFYTNMTASDTTGATGPTLNSGVQLFHEATHSNRGNNKGALSLDNIKAMHNLMAAQTGIGGEKIALTPVYLIVDPTERLPAHEFTSDIVGHSGATNVVTGQPHVFGKDGAMPLQVLCSEYVENGFYGMAANPAIAPVFEVGFLNSDKPQLLQESANSGLSFSHHIMRFRIDFQFGMTALDYRGLVLYKEASD